MDTGEEVVCQLDKCQLAYVMNHRKEVVCQTAKCQLAYMLYTNKESDEDVNPILSTEDTRHTNSLA